MKKSQQEQIKEAVKEHYAERAREHDQPCCGPACCGGTTVSLAQMLGYDPEELTCVPEEASEGSLGCGNPLGFCEIQEGEVVLDLGSGLGMDVILAAQRVGPTGKVIGLDMTPEMIERATRHAEKAGVGDIVDFRLGEMENMPVESESVDWIVSNCVVNLSPDKERVFQEAHRVLKPGGKMLISDLVSSGLSDGLKQALSSWVQCLGGTLEEADYLRLIREAGFDEVSVVDKASAVGALLGADCCGGASEVKGLPKVDSIKVRAVKGARE